MNFLAKLKDLFLPRSFAETEFGLSDIDFFLALLRASPDGSRLTFHQDEDEAFVATFRAWSHPEPRRQLEADYYIIDRRFVAEAEKLAAAGHLRLEHHMTLVGPDERLLCDSVDQFTIVTVAEDISEHIRRQIAMA